MMSYYLFELKKSYEHIMMALFARLNQPINCDFIQLTYGVFFKIVVSYNTKKKEFTRLVVFIDNEEEFEIHFIKKVVPAEITNLLREWFKQYVLECANGR